MTEVEVDLDDYVDEILEECDDDELIKEVEKRGHRVYRKGNRVVAFEDQPVNFNSPEDLRRILEICFSCLNLHLMLFNSGSSFTILSS